jgi:hypothetical protein
MMNPLQAMAAARQANQMPGIGIQSQGAAPAINPLQYAQMNTPLQPQMMNAPAARLQEMDKQKYVDSALNREQRNKELIFNTMNAADGRAHQMALEEQRLANQMQMEGMRHENVLAAHKYEQDAIFQRQQREMKFKQDQASLLQQMTDERYAPLREQTARVLDDYNKWIGGEEQATRERLFESRVGQLALSTIKYEQIEEAYKNNPNYQGQAVPKPFSKEHIDMAINMLKSTPEGQAQVSQLLTLVDREVLQMGQQKAGAFRSSMDQLAKLGFSVPETPEPLVTNDQVNGITTLPDPSFIPTYILDDQSGMSKNGSEGNSGNSLRPGRTGRGNNYSVMSPISYGSDPFPKKEKKKKEKKEDRPSRRTG